MHREFRERALSLLSNHGELELEKFWELVSRIRWEDPAAPHDDPLVGAGLRECVLAHSQFWTLRFALEKRLQDWEGGKQKIPCGDDSFNDLVSHVVGLGEETYLAMMAKPSLAVARAEARDYRESFGYVFQHALEKFPDDAVRSELIAAVRPRAWIDGESWPLGTLVEHEHHGLGIVFELAGGVLSVAFEGGPRVLPGSIETPSNRLWREATRTREPSSAIAYAVAAKLTKDDLVAHPVFGLGVVTAVGEGKATILFSTGEKRLVSRSTG